MSIYELAVKERIDHFNNKSWFVVQELESGEELVDVEISIEAQEKMLSMIEKEPDKYFTNQDFVKGFAYRLSRTNAGSAKYGPCEVCGKYADTMYMLVEMVRFWNPVKKKNSVTHHGCRSSTFGHKECLAKLTEKPQ
ncbi:hypothetical protein KUL42_39280 [Alteromonas sp. KUL42]|uniref:hypothetical protein n=1 Tax=Alteromonas sp. KUL42 TaxID=2480797 RepID=UPI001035A7BF|nr:hypothetical protein [Alteromonas sp. KUL42]TAP31732.1 hypothetical protein EYR97_19790 [Alteromonas sp. KUL42]GEA09167.1 hypothetical protein KUL42_39280 [Alteromonas sp. KUL42]